jgi:hypothetical protein
MLAETVTGLDVMAREKLTSGHRSLPLGLKFEDLQMAVARCHAEFVGVRGDDNTRVCVGGSTRRA